MAQDRIYLTCKGCGGSWVIAAIRANQQLDVPDVQDSTFTAWVQKHLSECHPVVKDEGFQFTGLWFNFGGDPGFTLETESRPAVTPGTEGA